MITKQPSYLQRLLQSARTLGFLLYVGGYAALLAWFKIVDVYHLHFATSGASVLIYNGFRILFIFYLFWIIWAPGALALRWLFRKFSSRKTLECLVLSFFAGAGLWHIAMLALGYLDLYTVPIAVAVSVPAVALSYPSARGAISKSWRNVKSWQNLRLDERLAIGAIGVVGGLLLLIKGIFPGGGHDYYTHYFYYYQAVIDHGGLWPNEVWYHYYYSKGLGLFFLGMLLTDPLAPQLVMSCFMAVATVALYIAVTDIAAGTSWPAASAILFIGIYIFTPGWGEFEKDHEFNTALIVGIIWMAQRGLQSRAREDISFVASCGLAIAAAVIINTQIGAYFAAMFALVGLMLFAMRHHRAALICAALTAWSGTVVGLILILNYATTGLLIDQGIVWLWPLANVEKLYAWGSLPMVIQLYAGVKGFIANTLPLLSLDTAKLGAQSLRLETLFPLVITAIGLACFSLFTRRKSAGLTHINAPLFYTTPIVIACLLAFFIIFLTIGRTQSVSFHRYSTFMVPVIILSVVILWQLAIPLPMTSKFRISSDRWAALTIAAVCLLAGIVDTRFYRFLNVPADAVRFMFGRASIDDAYVMKGGWPYHSPWGAIYPGARAAYAIVGRHTPIWSLHINTYCMLPDCRMEEYMSFNMT